MAAAPGSAAVAELIGANGGRWVSSAGGAFAVQGGNVVDMRDGSVIATLRPAVGAPSMLMQNVAVEVRNVPYFGEITDYRPAWVVDAARSSERQVTWVGERTHREIDPPDEITWTPLVRARPFPRPPLAPAADPSPRRARSRKRPPPRPPRNSAAAEPPAPLPHLVLPVPCPRPTFSSVDAAATTTTNSPPPRGHLEYRSSSLPTLAQAEDYFRVSFLPAQIPCPRSATQALPYPRARCLYQLAPFPRAAFSEPFI